MLRILFVRSFSHIDSDCLKDCINNKAFRKQCRSDCDHLETSNSLQIDSFPSIVEKALYLVSNYLTGLHPNSLFL